jgi:hypothetical protein
MGHTLRSPSKMPWAIAEAAWWTAVFAFAKLVLVDDGSGAVIVINVGLHTR